MNLLISLLCLLAPTQEALPIRTLIVSGANNHDWAWTTPRLVNLLNKSGKFDCQVTYNPIKRLARPAGLEMFQLFVLDYNGPRWGEAGEQAFLKAVHNGAGVVVIHAANNAFPGWVEYEKLVGHLWREGTSHGKFHSFDVKIVDRDHPVTSDLSDLIAHPDELYHGLVHMHDAEHRILATALSSKESGGSGREEPMIMVGAYGKGRVFHTPLGHVWKGGQGRESFLDARFRDLIARGSEWAATGKVTTGGAAPNQLSSAEQAAGWRLLFDGQSFKGWRGFQQDRPPEGWRVEDGALVTQAGGPDVDLISEAQFGDMEFSFEWQVTEKANSGIMVRVTEDSGATYHSGPEYQVLDDVGQGMKPDDPHSAGALYGLVSPNQKVLRNPGGWNSGRIQIKGWEMIHWLNDQKLLTVNLSGADGRTRIKGSKFSQWPGFAQADRGHIALQDHGDEVRFRSLKVREL